MKNLFKTLLAATIILAAACGPQPISKSFLEILGPRPVAVNDPTGQINELGVAFVSPKLADCGEYTQLQRYWGSHDPSPGRFCVGVYYQGSNGRIEFNGTADTGTKVRYITEESFSPVSE